MSKDAFKGLIKPIAGHIVNRPLDASLAAFLNQTFSGDSPGFRAIETACRCAIEEGWMCARQHGGIRYGRVIEADEELAGCSLDVVRMEDIAGPYHRHPHGEIDMVMPLTGNAQFDGAPRGWKVYEPGSGHRPTVTGGAALILYLLPGGAIDFTRP